MKKFIAVLGVDNDPTSYMIGLPPAVRAAMMRGVPPGVVEVGGRREFLLERFPPIFPNVLCRHVTLAYSVGLHYPLPLGGQQVTIVGQCVREGTQALVVMVNGKLRREDGKLFHLTMSVADGVPPAKAGDFQFDTPELSFFDSAEMEEMDLWAFLAPKWPIAPERNQRLAA